MRVLVLGGAGYIGSHVVHSLLEKKYEVTVYDSLYSGRRKNFPDTVPFIEGDILDEEALKKVFSETWDGVIHLAALKAAGDSMFEPERYARCNITGMINILNILASKPCPFIFSSSAAIFGSPLRLPVDEEHPKNPENFYGFTKLEAERILEWYGRLKGVNHVSLRYFNAAGYDLRGRVTGLEKNPGNLLPIILETAAGKREMLTVFGQDYDTPDGTCIRDYIHVSDLAEAHVLSLEYLAQGGESVALNLGSEQGVSVTEMVQKACALTEIDIPHRYGERRAGDPAHLVASSAKARSLLGWAPRFSDSDTLIRSAWEIYRKEIKGGK